MNLADIDLDVNVELRSIQVGDHNVHFVGILHRMIHFQTDGDADLDRGRFFGKIDLLPVFFDLGAHLLTV